MTTKDEAMRIALEALENCKDSLSCAGLPIAASIANEAITAIKQAEQRETNKAVGAALEHAFKNFEAIAKGEIGFAIPPDAVAIAENGQVSWLRGKTLFGTHYLYAEPKQAQSEVMVNMTPPATARDKWMYEQGRLAERDPRTHAIEQAQEPVDPIGYFNGRFGTSDEKGTIWAELTCYGPLPRAGAKLYEEPPAPKQAEPDGYKLVPVEPTEEMCAAAVKFANGDAVYKNVAAAALEIEEGIYGEAYRAMLAAAPTPPEAK